MSTSEAVEIESGPTRTWKDILVADRWRLLGVLLLAAGLAVYLGYDNEIPRWLRLFAITAGIGIALGYAPAARIVAWLYRPTYTYLVDVDSRTDEFAIWQLPPKVWRDLEVTEGELYDVRAIAPAWECREYDPEENTAIGTWRGSASDLELIEDRDAIDEIRTILEELAQEGLSIRIKQSGIVRSAVRGIVMSFVEGFESETLYDGENVKKSVERALNRWNFESDSDGGSPASVTGPGEDGSYLEEIDQNPPGQVDGPDSEVTADD